MRFIILFIAVSLASGCAAPPKKLTPLETLQAYTRAIKKKDTTQMKMLLSQESLKMAEQEAKAQNVTVDDIVTRETLFTESQTSVKYRNVREDEENKASVEMEDSMGLWNTVHFIREEGVWKIDKKGFANQIEIDSQKSQEELDRIINEGKQP
ncbi:MAG: hypothetical protein IPK58_14645 [Acidobacteria bacterium]|nr:hypothetical protein [Acidobacteriota bacterium]